jgi:WD40 repeat protein
LLTQHTGSVWSVAFVPGKDQALSCSHSETILWDLKNDSPLKIRDHSGTRHLDRPKAEEPKLGFGRIRDPDDFQVPTGVATSSDGKSAVFGTTSSLILWDLENWKKVKAFKYQHSGVVNVCVAYSPDGKRALYANHSNVVRLFDTVKQEELKASFPGWVACFSTDGTKVLTGDRDGSPSLLHYRDIDRKQRLKSFGTFRFGVNAVAIASTGKYALAAATRFDHDAVLWDLETFTETRRLKGHDKPIRALGFSPDGKFAVTGSEDGTARLWDVATGTELDRFTEHTRAVTSVAFSPGGGYVLTGGEDQGVGVWLLKKR